MPIGDDIQQKEFRDSHQKAMINLMYTSTWLNERMRVFLAPTDLTPQQFNVLRILRGAQPEPLSTLQIRERMIDKMSDTSRIVDRLVKKGFVEKSTCKQDKRLVDIFISQQGLNLLKTMDEQELQFPSHLSALSPEEAEHLSFLLDKIRD